VVKHLEFTWQEYLELGEELLRLPNTRALVEKLQDTVNAKLQCNSKLWLCEPHYPLPAEPPVDTLPTTTAPEIVQSAFQHKSLFTNPPDAPKNQNLIFEVALPLTTRDNTLGIFEVNRSKKTPFREDEIHYLEGLAAFAALSMQVNRQVTLKNWRYDQLSLVRSVSSQIANELDLDDLSKKVTNLIQCTFDYYYVGLYTLTPNTQQLQFRASSLECVPLSSPLHHVVYGEGLVGEVACTGKEILCKDVSKEPRYIWIDTLPDTKAEAVLPLIVENRILGVLDIQSRAKGAFHENDMLVIRSLSDNIALAVEGARLYNDLSKRADQLAALADLNYSFSQILDLDQLLKEVVKVIHDRFTVPFVNLYTVHPGRKKIIFQAGGGKRSIRLKANAFAFDLFASKGIIPQVARTGETILANDVSQHSLYKPSRMAPNETKAELTIPLKFGDEVLGILDLQSDQVNAFTEDDLSLFEGLASGIAISIRNANIFRTERWRQQVADSFKDVASLLSENVALDELLEKILNELEKNLPCDASAIWLVEPNQEEEDKARVLHLAAVRGTTRSAITGKVDESNAVRTFLEFAVEKNEPVIRTPTDPYGPLGAACNFKQNYSSIAVPMRSGNEVIGVLTLAHKSEGKYGSEASLISSTFASYAAIAIENTRLYTTAQEDAWSSTVLLQVAEAMQAISSDDELLAAIVRLTPLLVGINQCAVYLCDPNTRSFEMRQWYGFTPADNEKTLQDEDSVGLLRIQATMAPVLIEDAQLELGISSFTVDKPNGTLVLLPLRSHDELMGLFLVGHNSSGEFGISNKFTDQTLAILSGIAQQTSVTLENIRLVENRQEEAYITEVLLQVAQAVVSQNDLSDVLDTVVHLLAILVGLDAGLIYLWNKETENFILASGSSQTEPEVDEKIGTVFKSGEIPLLDEVLAADDLVAYTLPATGTKVGQWNGENCQHSSQLDDPSARNWVLGIPLSIKGVFYGVLVAQESSVLPAFHKKRVELIKGIAQQTTLAIQNERLTEEMVGRERMEREFQLAREIQKTFLPESTPELPGWEIDLLWQTAREVGGDFYDLFEAKDHRLAIVIADVSDKGMPAALYMTVTRTLIRSAAQGLHSPASILERVNSLLEMESRNGMFVTAFMAMLDPETGTLTYANAGHNLPIWRKSKDNSCQRLEMDGIALGVTGDATYTDKKITLATGDYLLLYTDGVTEAMSDKEEFFTEQRLYDLIEQEKFSTSEELLHKIESAITAFRNGEAPSDDLTMISVHRKNN
jgi:serine phosphatase RsbU (regulator of sigma subunit)/putative methionine-R-sulfoxide reductase with GAF domain